jgi:hypothetical protein
VPLVELLEHVGFALGVARDGGDDLPALLVGGRLDEIRDLRRVEPGELGVRNPQAYGRNVSGEGLDRGPIEKAAGLQSS